MPTHPPKPLSWATKSIPFLFLALVLAQVLDLHSTLRGISIKQEQNHLINWLADQVGFTLAIVCVKAAAATALLFFYQTWRGTKGQLDMQVAAVLVLLAVISWLVVANNYLL